MTNSEMRRGIKFIANMELFLLIFVSFVYCIYFNDSYWFIFQISSTGSYRLLFFITSFSMDYVPLIFVFGSRELVLICESHMVAIWFVICIWHQLIVDAIFPIVIFCIMVRKGNVFKCFSSFAIYWTCNQLHLVCRFISLYYEFNTNL